MSMYICHNCKRELEELEDIRGKVGRQDVCPHCYADLHCCLNCRFHDPNYTNECRENARAFIRERDKSNFCSSFEFKKNEGDDGSDEIDAKSQLGNLFDL